MNRKILTFLFLLGVLIGSGCVGSIVPKTAIRGNFQTGEFRVLAPKDVEIQGLNITRLTNGAVQIHVDRYVGKNNPQVISAAVQGQVELVKAGGQAGGIALGQAMSIMAGKPPQIPQALPGGALPYNYPAVDPSPVAPTPPPPPPTPEPASTPTPPK